MSKAIWPFFSRASSALESCRMKTPTMPSVPVALTASRFRTLSAYGETG
ncbi:hypothetical protein RBB74_12280 [Tunturiibacter gelidiferens]